MIKESEGRKVIDDAMIRGAACKRLGEKMKGGFRIWLLMMGNQR